MRVPNRRPGRRVAVAATGQQALDAGLAVAADGGNAVDAFLDLHRGGNIGKMLIRL